MFGLGAGEIVVILLLGLIVLGPQKLPGLMKQVARMMGELRRVSDDMRRNFDEVTREESAAHPLGKLGHDGLVPPPEIADIAEIGKPGSEPLPPQGAGISTASVPDSAAPTPAEVPDPGAPRLPRPPS